MTKGSEVKAKILKSFLADKRLVFSSDESISTSNIPRRINLLLIHYLHKSYNTPLLLPKKICIGIVFDFSWDMKMSQEKLQTIVMQQFFFWGGGGNRSVLCGIVQVVNRPFYSSVLSYQAFK